MNRDGYVCLGRLFRTTWQSLERCHQERQGKVLSLDEASIQRLLELARKLHSFAPGREYGPPKPEIQVVPKQISVPSSPIFRPALGPSKPSPMHIPETTMPLPPATRDLHAVPISPSMSYDVNPCAAVGLTLLVAFFLVLGACICIQKIWHLFSF